ncbi:UrvD/REP family ATP-dependent DNA helicase [Brachybacterium aquaticum]|uniref:DNA 3'-5' helicase n=1 Tax=Brachybacterium aquaticum TaxID=1432564 RepID=A0A841AEZ1_9MICO|nr:UrvD/REP family ATP-dependent DNA helicase [Brachybacterium aquaticum]MBB5831895.1 superfamily I DNA/RNA helicase/CRISPR/Cas system-associated exonuclease Cas4 (RecB family) [Brachybacterium aquaticum]
MRRTGTPFEEGIRLLGPDLAALPALHAADALDAPQREALERFLAGSDVLVHGGPGSGRTALALVAADGAARALGAEETLLLAPRRVAAGRLRDAMAVHGAAGVRAMTPPALAHAIARADALRRGLGEPTLVTGAEQDALLAELIAERDTWHLDVDPGARTLPGFRTELRDLITRAGELGLTPAELAALGLEHTRPAWRDAAALLRDYLGVLDLEASAALDAGPRLDSGALVRRAATLLLRPGTPAPARAVIVDDAQDLTVSGLALVAALAAGGARVLVLASPDEAVDTFRGALPDAADRLRTRLPRPAAEVTLTGAPGRRAEITALVDALRGRLPLAGAPAASRRPRVVMRAVADAAVAAGEPTGAAHSDGSPAGIAPCDAATASRAAGLVALRAGDPLDEARLIGSALRDLHHREGVDYDDMAVVCRSGAAVADVADLLARTGLPVRIPRRPQPLRDVPAVADLLRILEIGLAPDGTALDPLTASELLRGPFGDADDLRLRRIRRLLLAAHRRAENPPAVDEAPSAGEAPSAAANPSAEDPEPTPPAEAPSAEDPALAADPAPPVSSAELLARALVEPDVPGLPDPEARDRAAAPVHRVRAMIAAVRAHRDQDAEQVLWQAWDASGLAGGWRRAALGDAGDADGARARLAASRLDALLELFAAAERLTERRPGAGALDLVEQIRGQAVVEDTLAPAAGARGRLAVLTPAQLAGEHRDTVVLARVQEGAWPDLRLRSTLFGAADLSLLTGLRGARPDISGPDPADPAVGPEELRALQRDQVLADELRLAVSALARARTRVLVTAVEDEQSEPSALFEVLEEQARRDPASWVDAETLRLDPGPAPDARRLVAALRRRLRDPDPDRARDAALALDALGRAGAPGTDPARWYHQAPSSTAPLHDQGETIILSPSALERAVDCPQSWLMERAGGTRAGGPAQLLGTALHLLAQTHPCGEGDLLGALHTLLRGMPGTDTWSGRRRVRRAEDSARLLAEHLAGAAGEPLALEAPFEVDLGRVRLRGSIDRIEGDATGLRVVDLKSGRTAKSAAKAEEDLQLAAYQAAVREGALAEQLGEDAPERLNGAQLVYVGTGGKKAAVRTQGALTRADDPAWFDDLVEAVSRDVSGAQVTARRNAHCDHCAVRASCPLQPEGDQL